MMFIMFLLKNNEIVALFYKIFKFQLILIFYYSCNPVLKKAYLCSVLKKIINFIHMKYKFISFITFISILYSFFSCRKVIEIELPSKDGKIVINSFFSSRDSLVINISKSLHILDNIESKLLNDAEVIIYENNIFKEKLTNINNGNYIARTFIPSNDKLYKVIVKYNNLNPANSENIIPNPIKIISVDTSTVYVTNNNGMNQGGGNSYPQYQLKIRFKDTENFKNYYSIRLYVKSQNYYYKNTSDIKYFDYMPLYFSSNDLVIESWQSGEAALFSDDFINGKEYNLLINIDKYNFPNTNNEVIVEINSLSKDYFFYSKSYNLYQSVKGDPFSEPVQVYNNIENGFGIFAGYSSDTLGLNLKGEPYYYIE